MAIQLASLEEARELARRGHTVELAAGPGPDRGTVDKGAGAAVSASPKKRAGSLGSQLQPPAHAYGDDPTRTNSLSPFWSTCTSTGFWFMRGLRLKEYTRTQIFMFRVNLQASKPEFSYPSYRNLTYCLTLVDDHILFPFGDHLVGGL